MLDDFRNEDLNNSGEFLDEFRQRLNSQPIDNIDERRSQINRSQQIFISTILGIGLAGAVSWFIFSSDYDKSPDAEIPVVRRPQTAIKVQPADPGGMEILNQDKTVYDIVEKNDEQNKGVESLLPPPEEPNIPLIEEVKETAEITAEPEIKTAADDTVDAVQTPQGNNGLLPPATEIKKPVLKETVEDEIKVVEVVATEKKNETQAAVKQPVSSPKTADDAASANKNKIPTGVWQIQLMSTPNEKAIDKAWVGLKSKYPELGKLAYETEVADLGAKGTYYRLKAGAFIDRGEADKLCNSIKNSGGTCLVKKK
mgnify:CR=1 FL=1